MLQFGNHKMGGNMLSSLCRQPEQGFSSCISFKYKKQMAELHVASSLHAFVCSCGKLELNFLWYRLPVRTRKKKENVRFILFSIYMYM